MPLVPSEVEKQQERQAYNSPQRRLEATISTARLKPTPYPAGKRRETLDELEASETFQRDAQVVLQYFGTNDDIFEALRDADYNIGKGLYRAATVGNWPEDVKEAYARVKTRFDNAETGSFNQYLEAAKDIGIDIISDPTTIAAFLFSPFTGGASLGARQVAAEATRQGLKKFVASKTVQSAAAGAAWTGTDDFARQVIEDSVGMRDGLDAVQTLSSIAIGGAVVGFVGKFLGPRPTNKAKRIFDEIGIDEILVEGANFNRLDASIRRWISKTVGKPAGFLKSYEKAIPTAGEVMRLFRYDLGRELSTVGNRVERDVSKPDLYRNINRITGDYWQQIQEAVNPITFNRTGILDKDVNDELVRALRTGKSDDEAINTVAKQVRGIMNNMFKHQAKLKLLNQDKGMVQNYFRRMWNRAEIEKSPEELAKKFVQVGQAPDMNVAREIVNELLDKKNQLGSTAAELYNLPRVFDKIKDDSGFEKYLNNDFNEVMFDYVVNASRKMAGVETFGVRTLKEFEDKYLNKMLDEAASAGIELPKSFRKDLRALYQNATGEGIHHVEGKLGVLKDWTAVGFQLSMLPLATLSSLTEVILPLTKVNPPTYVKSLSKAIGIGVNNTMRGVFDTLGVKHNMSKSQITKEMNRFMIAMDQAAATEFERLSGEAAQSKILRKAQNTFFKLNLLTPWTRMVEATAFISGKDLIRQNLTALSKTKNFAGTKAIRMKNELSDLGIDYLEGLKWLKEGGKEDNPFYNKLLEGAAVFTREVILPTSRHAGTRPHIQSNPRTDIFFQFMGYPTAFSNIVMKNMATEMAESPLSKGFGKIIPAAVIMTAMARMSNYLRSGGESEAEAAVANFKALQRWGGNGMVFDMMIRAQRGAETMGIVGGAMSGMAGPLVGEVVQAIGYRKGPSQILGTKIPGYGAMGAVFGAETMDDYNTWLRAQDRKLAEIMGVTQPAPRKLMR